MWSVSASDFESVAVVGAGRKPAGSLNKPKPPARPGDGVTGTVDESDDLSPQLHLDVPPPEPEAPLHWEDGRQLTKKEIDNCTALVRKAHNNLGHPTNLTQQRIVRITISTTM
jgi:hypothetical protein